MISVNLDKAKAIAHDARRSFRGEEFRPFDEIIMKQIPGAAFEAAEAQRQSIREKYVDMQTAIDAATHVDHLTAVLKPLASKE